MGAGIVAAAGLTSALVVLAPPPAVAAPAAGDRWNAPARCPDAAGLRSALERRMGDRAAAVRVQGAVARHRNGFHAEVVIAGPWGETRRTMSSPDCTTLVDAIALIAAVSADPLAVDSAPGATTPPTSEAEATSADARDDGSRVAAAEATTVARVPEPEPVPRPASPLDGEGQAALDEGPPDRALDRGALRATIRAGGSVGAGLLPRIDGAVGGGVGLWWPRARIDLAGTYFVPQSVAVENEADAAGRVSAWSVGARGCPVLSAKVAAWLEIPLCAGLDVGQMRGIGVGDGLSTRRSVRRPWVAVAAGPSLVGVVAPWLAFFATAEAVVPVYAPGYAIGGAGEVHRPGPVAARAALGVELRLGGRREGGNSR